MKISGELVKLWAREYFWSQAVMQSPYMLTFQVYEIKFFDEKCIYTDLNFNESFVQFCFITEEQNETLKSFLD